jgi:hypothetical protein
VATTLANFVKMTAAQLVGATVQAAGQLVALNGSNAAKVAAGAGGTVVDKLAVDFSTDALAKHGAARFTFSGTTPKNMDLTDLTSASASSAGDTTFATISQLVFYNDGAADITVAPGGSNPASIGLAGTTPTLNVPAGKSVAIPYAAAVVDGTHKVILMTPTAGGSLVVSVGGA